MRAPRGGGSAPARRERAPGFGKRTPHFIMARSRAYLPASCSGTQAPRCAVAAPRASVRASHIGAGSYSLVLMIFMILKKSSFHPLFQIFYK